MGLEEEFLKNLMDYMESREGNRMTMDREQNTTSKGAKKNEGEPVVLTDGTIDAFVAAHPRAVVDCYTTWCGPCRDLAKDLKILAKKHADKIAFGKVDVEDNTETSKRYSVMAVPIILVFRDGELEDACVGAPEMEELEEWLLDVFEGGE